MTADQASAVSQSQNISQSLFDNFVSTMTGGVIPDLHTAMICAVALFGVYIAFDVIYTVVYKTRVDEFFEARQEARDYQQYKKRRDRSARFRRMYEMDRAGGPLPDK